GATPWCRWAAWPRPRTWPTSSPSCWATTRATSTVTTWWWTAASAATSWAACPASRRSPGADRAGHLRSVPRAPGADELAHGEGQIVRVDRLGEVYVESGGQS